MALWLPHTYHVSRIRIMDLRRCAAARGGRGVFDVSRIRITHTSFSPQSFARGTVQWPARRVPYVPRLTFPDYVSRPARPRPPPPPLRITHTHYALRIFHRTSQSKAMLQRINGTKTTAVKCQETPSPPTVKQFPRGLTGPTHSRLQRRAGLAPTPRPFASATGEERRGGRAGEARSHIPSHTQRWLARR